MGFLGRVAGIAATGWLRESSPDEVYWLVECDLSDKFVSGVPRVFSIISVGSNTPVPIACKQLDGPFHQVGCGNARAYDGNLFMFHVHGVFANLFDARKLLMAVPLNDAAI